MKHEWLPPPPRNTKLYHATNAKLFNEELMCFVKSVTYDFTSHVGSLDVMQGECAHIPGLTAFFKRIDPRVVQIQVRNGVTTTLYDLATEKSYIIDRHGVAEEEAFI
jgi:hypothetical protein